VVRAQKAKRNGATFPVFGFRNDRNAAEWLAGAAIDDQRANASRSGWHDRWRYTERVVKCPENDGEKL
jgi:hypothetical protein